MTQLFSSNFASVEAQSEASARSFRHLFITSEHLLMGILRTKKCQAQKFLAQKSINLKDVKELAANKIGNGTRAPKNEIPLSFRSLSIVRNAENFASGYNTQVGTLHLLWSILQDRGSEAAMLLIELNKGSNFLSEWTSEIEEILAEPTTRRPEILSFNSNEKSARRSDSWRTSLANASAKLRDKIIGRDSAIERVADTLTRSWAGLFATGRPMASFLFVGPRGSGKQTLARNIAKFLYDDSERIVRISLEDFSDEMRAGQLLGMNQGNEDLTSVLTRAVKDKPYSIIYLEDAERAHAKAMEWIHQIIERGHIFDAQGQRVEFRDNVIVLSVVVDPDFFEKDEGLGFRINTKENKDSQEQYERTLMPDLERVLRADTVRLVDEAIFFPPLSGREMTDLLEAWTRETAFNIAQRHNIKLTIEPEVYDYLIDRNKEFDQGAGSLKRLFTREVCTNFAKALLEGKIGINDKVKVKIDDGKVVIVKK